jgi:hypothetical protein
MCRSRRVDGLTGGTVSTVKRVLVTVVCAALVGACSADASPTASKSSASPPAGSAGTASESTSTTAAEQSGLDVHAVEWTTIAAPGEACQTAGQIQLHDEVAYGGVHYGTALVPDEQRGLPEPPYATGGPKYVRIDYTGGVTYGDLNGDGRDEAAVPLWCSNGGGTADGALLYSLAMFTGQTGTLQLVGLITAQQQLVDELPTLLSNPKLTTGAVVVQEAWYGPHDSTCCPSGQAVSTWAYTSGQLRPESTAVTVEPNSS